MSSKHGRGLDACDLRKISHGYRDRLSACRSIGEAFQPDKGANMSKAQRSRRACMTAYLLAPRFQGYLPEGAALHKERRVVLKV